jgi:hypothetical protein
MSQLDMISAAEREVFVVGFGAACAPLDQLLAVSIRRASTTTARESNCTVIFDCSPQY